MDEYHGFLAVSAKPYILGTTHSVVINMGGGGGGGEIRERDNRGRGRLLRKSGKPVIGVDFSTGNTPPFGKDQVSKKELKRKQVG